MSVPPSKAAASPSPPPSFARRTGRDLTTGSIPRHLIAFSLPMLAGSALQTAYSFINAIWVGKYLGTAALAAVTVSFPVIFVLIAVGAGMTLATNILIAQYYGASDPVAVRRVVDSSTFLVGGLSLLLMIVGQLLAPAILRAMRTPPEVLPLAIDYMRIFLLTMPLMFGLFLTRNMLQGIGDSTTPLYFQTGAVLLTAVLDPILMFGWLGAPALGLNGTAWATIIAQILGLAALVTWLRRRGSLVAPALNWRRFDWATTWTTVRIGVPSAVQQSLVSVGMVFVVGIVNDFGTNAAAAFGAASRVDQLAFMPAMTIGMATSTLAGQNIGANRHHRVREILLWGCLFSGTITLTASVLAVSLPGPLLRIFTNDSAVIELGTSYLRIVGLAYVFFAVMFVSNGIINGSGHTLVTTGVTLITLWVVRVPTAYLLSGWLASPNGIWLAIALSFAVAMLTSLSYYATGRWRRPIVRRRPQPAAPAPDAEFAEETGEA